MNRGQIVASSRHHTSDSHSFESARPDFNSHEAVEFIAGCTPAVREMIEPDTELRRRVDTAVLARGHLVRERMATRYNTRH